MGILVIIIGPDSFYQLSLSSFAFQVNLDESKGGVGLPVDQMPKLGLPPNNVVENLHLTIQDRQEDNQLNGIHIMSNHYQLNLFAFHQCDDSINPAQRTNGFLVGTSPLSAAFFSAQTNNLCFFSCIVSGLYLWISLSSWVAGSSRPGWTGWSQEAILDIYGELPCVPAARYSRTIWQRGWGPFGLSDAKILGPFLNGRKFLASSFFIKAGARASFFTLVFFPFGTLDSWRRELFIS